MVDTLLFGAGGQITQVTLAIMSDDRERWRRELAEQRGTLGSPFAADANCTSSASACTMSRTPRCATEILTVPTAFTIDPDQVHHLVEAGHQALRRSAEFQQLRRSLDDTSTLTQRRLTDPLQFDGPTTWAIAQE